MTPVDLTGLRAARQRITAGVWLCAAITMTTSALTGYGTVAALDPTWALLGLLTGLAVDVGLCVGLIGDRQLHAHGLTSPYGRLLRYTTGAMAVMLNCGAALIHRQWFLALIHACIPTVLVVVTEYGQSVILSYTALIRDTEITEQTATTQAVEAQRQQAAQAAEQARQGALPELASAPTERPAALSLVPRRVQPSRSSSGGTRRASPVRDTAVTWLARQVVAGRDLTAVHYRDLAEAIGAKPDTCKKSINKWITEVQQRSEVPG